MMVRVFNVNTMEKIREFEAHMDYIRSLEVHPTQPYLLTCSDDMQIKMWDWEKNWANTQCFDGHSHYVMMVKFNPKDANSFASASLDRSVKVWSLGSPLPNFSLEGHTAGVNCIDYFQGGDKPYIASGSDDFTVKIFDYQTKAIVHTLLQHTNNVSAVVFHPSLPIILSGSEDGTVRVWHSTTYRLETSINYGMERCWTLGVSPSSNKVAIGYDEGVVVLQMGREMPVVSMDKSGKVLLATTKDVQSGAIRGVSHDVHDGERLDFQTKTAGPTEVYPQSLEHNSNGRFVVVCGDGEYIVYTAQALRNKSFGSGLDFGWSTVAPNDYCVLDTQSRVHIFTDFKETAVINPTFTAEALFGGFLVGVAGTEHVVFYTWAGKEVVRIDVVPKKVMWSEDGDHVALLCEDSYYILAVDTAKMQAALANGDQAACEASFEYLDEVAEQGKTGLWAGDCFVYTNVAGRLNYYVGGEVITMAHLDREMLLLGYLAKENRIFLMDKQRTICSYQLLENVLKYQTAVVRKDFDTANALLGSIPRQQHGKIARFLESQGHKEAALQVTTDPDHKFELALQLEKFEVALQIMRDEAKKTKGSELGADDANKWKQLGDLALSRGNVGLAEECAELASDYTSLLLIYSSTGQRDGLHKLAAKAKAGGLSNVAFICHLLLGDAPACIGVLSDAGRTPEAALMALNYAPSLVADLVAAWKKQVLATSPHAARAGGALASPVTNPELFPGYADALAAEAALPKSASSSAAAAASTPAKQAAATSPKVSAFSAVSPRSQAPQPSPQVSQPPSPQVSHPPAQHNVSPKAPTPAKQPEPSPKAQQPQTGPKAQPQAASSSSSPKAPAPAVAAPISAIAAATGDAEATKQFAAATVSAIVQNAVGAADDLDLDDEELMADAPAAEDDEDMDLEEDWE